MIFKEILKEKEKAIRPAFDALIDLAFKKQAHIGDLLLININGFYDPNAGNMTGAGGTKLSPYVIGNGSEGLSEHTHYTFIHKYRTTYLSKLTHKEYLKELEYTKEKREYIDKLVDSEGMTIQLEMLIYLKFWEADLVIKKFYQLVRLLYGEPYDWHFKILESSRGSVGIGTRQEIIRKMIRERIKKISPPIYDLIKSTYKTQIRNSIAHSNYSFLGRNIHPNNYIAKDPSCQLRNVPFDEWIDIFHNTLILHNEYIRMKHTINTFYAELAMLDGNSMEIAITRPDGKQTYTDVEYRQKFEDWRFKRP